MDMNMMLLTVVVLPFLLFTSSVRTASTAPCSTDSQDDGLHVDCSGRQLTSFLVTWPDHVVWLDLSHNNLSDLTDLKTLDQQLASLRHLDLSHNQLNGTLASNTLATLPHLTWLSLQHNRLQGLEVGALTGLRQLTFLDLSHNHILLDNKAYPPGVFGPLTSLLDLRLLDNDDRPQGQFPEGVFTSLSRLNTLSIDTFPYCQFGSAFSVLTRLASLLLGSDCKLKELTNSTLAAFKNSSLEKLQLNAKHLIRLETCAFCHLPKLKVLSFTGSVVGLPAAMETLYGLQNHKMDLIDFSRTRNTGTPVTIDNHNVRYIRTICVTRFKASNTNIQRVTSTSVYCSDYSFTKCIQEIDVSRNRIVGDRAAYVKTFLMFKRLQKLDMNTQYVYSVEKAGWGLADSTVSTLVQYMEKYNTNFTFNCPPNLSFMNLSTASQSKFGLKYTIVKFRNCQKLKTLDFSYSWMPKCIGTLVGLTALEFLDLSGNYCHFVSETVFDHLPSLRHLRLSDFHINREFFRTRAWRLFQKLTQLQILDLSYNDLIHLDLHMLRAQRHLQQLSLAGNRLQSLSVDLGQHEDLRVLDVSHNMLPTLLPHERRALDKLAAMHDVTLKLRGNPLLCACSNLDMVRWLWMTSVKLDGEGENGRNYTCVTETGEAWDTHSVMLHYDWHWRRCVGQQVLGAVSAVFLLQLLVLVMVYVVSRSWTHICYAWKVMKRLRLPQREDFRRDAYVGYADADWELACVKLRHCLGERHGVRLLLRAFEEQPGSVRAENIVQHMDACWKVLLLVTRAFATDEWLCGFTAQQAQRSITDTMPNRVIVVLLEDPARLPPMASLERLLRMVPETNVFHVRRDTSPLDPVWYRLSQTILGQEAGH